MKKYITFDQIETTSSRQDEQEFTIVGERCESDLHIYASDNTFITKMKHCMKANPDEFKCWEAGRDSDGCVTGYFFSCPKKLLTIRMGTKVSSAGMTDEAKLAASERLKAYWAEKKKNNEA